MLEKVKTARQNMYSKCRLQLVNFSCEDESSKYYAHSFAINGKDGLFRIAKKTPTKSGWFVTIWKRGSDNIIAPYDESDAVDFVVIAVIDGKNIGEFIFPKIILSQKDIFSSNGKEGKRAIRVYTPWDKTTSVQASKTRAWQQKYFVDLNSSYPECILKIKNLYSI